MEYKFTSMIKRESNGNTLDFVISYDKNTNKNVLGIHYQRSDRIEIFLDRIARSCYKRIKKDNKYPSNFIGIDSNNQSNEAYTSKFEDIIDKGVFDCTTDKITEVLLHELTHKFGNVGHPEDYKIGYEYFINYYIDKLYNEANFPKMELEAKEILKKCCNIQSYTTNDFNNKLRKIIYYCKDR